ncbi:hypothetical protein bsdtw1_01850 [Clostridium fungisolvens]|uniref:Uncharacterized protein n=1 Tax=Clostridium fungisolvens TaxID=1604897 RepID=A0A6V8SKS5_9CLOT|nr:hypothetical protein bsdtw1_01850 [Clostridium fungisolvens]
MKLMDLAVYALAKRYAHSNVVKVNKDTRLIKRKKLVNK